jgi:hypothetical protein
MALATGAVALGRGIARGVQKKKAKKVAHSQPDYASAGMGLAGQAIGAGAGYALGKKTGKDNDKRQLAMEGKLQNMQAQKNKEMALYNQQMGMKTWDETNYSAQRKQLEKAGLNAGLLYGMGGGSGGTYAQGNASGVGASSAPSGGGELMSGVGMGMGVSNMTTPAQLQLMQAQSTNTDVDSVKQSGVETDLVKARIAELKQMTTNEKVQESILRYEKRLAEIDLNVASRTYDEKVELIKNESESLIQEIRKQERENDMGTETFQAMKAQVITGVAEQQLKMDLMRAGIKVDEATVKKYAAEVIRLEAMTDQGEKDLAMKKLQVDFNTSLGAKAGQWSKVLLDVGKTVGELKGW